MGPPLPDLDMYLAVRPARPVPSLCCGTAAASGRGLRLLALGASVKDPPAPGLFLTPQRLGFARGHPSDPSPCGGSEG
jgi:hypothetical protein